jgi:hypothetical protein
MFLCVLCLLLGAPALAQTSAVLNASAGPSDNEAPGGSALLFDLEASTGVVITGFSTASSAPPGATYQVTVHTRPGTALGGPVNMGPGSSPDGWRNLGSFTVTQGSGEVSLPIALPSIAIGAGQTLGVAVVFPPGFTARYLGLGTPPIQTFSDGSLTLRSGDARSAPFTTGGNFFSSRTLVGSIEYRPADPTLNANPGPPNNFGRVDSAMFFNLQSDTGAVLQGLTTATTSPPGTLFLVDVYTRQGTALGNVAGSGPATSSAGWTFRGTATGIQGAGAVTQPMTLPSIAVPAGQTVGVGLVYRGVQPNYFGTGSAPIETYGTPTLTLTTGDALSIPFSPSAEVFSSRALVGNLIWRPAGLQLGLNPGPTDNGNGPGTGQFFDVVGPSDAAIRGLRVATNAAANTSFQVQVYTRNGTALGGTAATGPGSSSAGWTLHSSTTVTQGSTGPLSEPLIIPEIPLVAGQIRGIGVVILGASPAYRGLGAGSIATYSTSGVEVTTGEARTLPFTTTGALFAGRQFVGSLYFRRNELVFRNGFE